MSDFDEWVMNVVKPQNGTLSQAVAEVHDDLYCAQKIAEARGMKGDGTVIEIARLIGERVELQRCRQERERQGG